MRAAAWFLVAAIGCLPALGLETDQFYAWKHPLTDSTAAINAKINAEIAAALHDVNSRLGADNCNCDRVRKAIRHRFSWLLFQKPELWASNTATVDRVPGTRDEELKFLHEYLYSAGSALDPIKFMPPSPTILVNGVRIGTDKIGHFFSEGAWLFISYHYYVRNGRTEAESVEHALNLGLASEKSILGQGVSGIFSLADVEANYQGLLFWKDFCRGPDPNLVKTAEGWWVKRPFDIARYVAPEWDESWEPNVYEPSRWKKVEPVMKRYCSLLADPEVQAQRASYAARTRYTISEKILGELVKSGKLKDPAMFTIEAVCGLPLRDVLAPPRAAGDDGEPAGVPGVEVGPREP